MHQVTVHEAKTHLSRLIRESLGGDEVVIARGNQPLVKLVPIAAPSTKRTPGGCPDLVVEMDNDFNGPLQDFEEYM